MRKFTIATIPAFVLALALSAAAQEKPITTNKENKDTLKASVSGNVVLDYIWRSSEITSFNATAFGPLGVNQDAQNTFEGHLAIRMDVDLNDKVAAVVEFGTKRVDGGAILNWGDATADAIQLREARVVVSDFLTQGLKFGAGIADWSFDVRGKGSAMAFDPRHSQSALRNSGVFEDGAGALAFRGGATGECPAPTANDASGSSRTAGYQCGARSCRKRAALDIPFRPRACLLQNLPTSSPAGRRSHPYASALPFVLPSSAQGRTSCLPTSAPPAPRPGIRCSCRWLRAVTRHLGPAPPDKDRWPRQRLPLEIRSRWF